MRHREPSRDRRLGWAIGGLVLISTGWFCQSRDWNSASRLRLTASLVDHGSLSVPAPLFLRGDGAYRDGRVFCDKPPGHSWLAVPLYGLLSAAGHRLPFPARDGGFSVTEYLLTVGTSGAVSAVLAVCVWHVSRQLGCSRPRALLTTLAVSLGSPAFVYGTLFYGHQTSAAALFGGCVLLHGGLSGVSMTTGRAVLAGCLLGIAVLIDYSLLLPVECLVLLAAASGMAKRHALAAGTAFGLLLCMLAVYHQVAFGAWWQTGYAFVVEPAFQAIYSSENPIGLKAPSYQRLQSLLIGGRGLICWFPPASLLPVAFWRLRQRHPELAWCTATAFSSLLLLNACHPTWWGGWATGPRYLLGGLPLLAVPLAAWTATASRRQLTLFAALAIAGYLLNLASAACSFGGRLPDSTRQQLLSPVTRVIVPELAAGRFTLALPAWCWGGPSASPRMRLAAVFVLMGLQVSAITLLLFQAKTDGDP